MLEAIRKRSASIFIKGLFALLILSFISWGVGDFIRGRANVKVVATIGNVEVSPEALNRAYLSDIRRMEQLFGTAIDRDKAKSMGLVNMALARLINETLYSEETAKLGLTASNGAVRANIEHDRNFMDQTGKFNRNQFEQTLASNGFSEQDYVARLRSGMARDQLTSSVVAGTQPPKSLVEAIYRFRQEQRVAETVQVTDASIKDVGEPTNDQLVAFHKAHAVQFTAPEYRALTVVHFQAKDLEGEIKLTEKEIKDAYAQRQDEFDRPETRHLLQIVVDSKQKAEKIHQMLLDGGDFAKVAKDEAGLDKKTIDIGTVSRTELLGELAKAAFSLPDGGISEPVKSPLGWHVIKVVSINPAHVATLDEARPKLEKEVRHDKSIDLLYETANHLEDTLGGGATLEEAAKKMHLPISKISAIDARGKDPSGKPVADLPPGGNFLKTAFSTADNEDSLLTDAGSDGYFVLRVDKVTPSALKPLDTVRDQVVAAWKEDERAKKAKDEADKLAERLRSGGAIADIAKELGVEVKTTDPFTRLPSNAKDALPGGVVAGLFKEKVGGAVVGRDGKGYVIARLAKIIPANPGTDPNGVAAVKQSLVASMQRDLESQFVEALQQQFPVDVNQKAIDQMF